MSINNYPILFQLFIHVVSGFVQFIDSIGVADVLNEFGSIQNFFKKYAPCENGPYGIQPEVMDNYIKSCGQLRSNVLPVKL